ncbi:MAG: metallophosphoesterase [Anaerolineales bacterium]|nr:MAG: metallophosphoesterase [Anaerolineales bacterium]
MIELIYSPSLVENFRGVDMVLSCGDLPYYYLEYIVTMLNVPLLYVHGNHDPPIEYSSSGRQLTGPAGCINVHGRLVREKELSVVGLQGSIRYKPEGKYQYTDSEMWGQVLKMTPALLLNRLFTGRRMDILLAHSPPYGIHNGRDWTHVGFKSFLWLMRRFKPRYLIHGHRHVYNPLETTQTQYEQTMVINVYPYKILEIPDE